MDIGCSTEHVNHSQLPDAAVAVIYLEGSDYISGTTVATPPRSSFAQLLTSSSDQVVLVTTEAPETGTVIHVKMFDAGVTRWKLLRLESGTVRTEPDQPNYFRVEAKIRPADTSEPLEDPDRWYDKIGPQAADYLFFHTTSLIRSLPPDAVCRLTNAPTFMLWGSCPSIHFTLVKKN